MCGFGRSHVGQRPPAHPDASTDARYLPRAKSLPSPPAYQRVTSDSSPTARIVELRVYPIKSLAGVSVAASAVGGLGLALDRRWMLVDGEGTFLTQREHGRMALAVATPDGAGGLTVTAPGLPPLRVAPPPAGAARRRVRVWADTVEAAGYPADVDDWFSTHLGASVALVHLPDDVVRPVDPAYGRAGDRAAFADGFPLLVASAESLAELNARLVARGAEPVEMRRFRPNVVVAGVDAPFAEDGWRGFTAGGIAFDVVKPCARCVITTIDPESGVQGHEPLRTLNTFRRRNGKVLFAQNVIPRGAGTLRVGDVVTPMLD